jgi:predicted dienelactone hydrolase
MTRLFSIGLVVLLFGLPAEADEPANSKAGPLAVESEEFVVKDAARKKDLSCKVHYPKSGGPYPVILFSHGFAGNKDSFGVMGKHWAGHGYVVIHPTHADGRERRGVPAKGDEGDTVERPKLGGLQAGLSDPAKIADRVADLATIIDQLETLPKAVAGLGGKIDAMTIGVGGHSFGAYTAMLIGGVTADLGKETGRSFLDKRVKCILPVSAQGTGQQGLTQKSWDALKLPMMTITGTRDQGAGKQGVDWKKEPFKYSPAGDKYLVVIDGANHLSFGGGLGARNAYITDAVKLSSTHFWDSYLKGTETAKKYLQSDQLEKDTGGKCKLERK